MKEKILQLEEFVISIPQNIKYWIFDLVCYFFTALDKLKNLSNTNYELGVFHINNGNMNDAKMRFLFAIKLNPDFALSYYNLGRCYLFDLSFDKAKEAFAKAIEFDSSLENAKYRLSILNKNVLSKKIPIKVIEEDYDNFSNFYEDYVINQLHYKAPEILSERIADYLNKQEDGASEMIALDIGCGTGLVGTYLRQYVSIKSLTGIDVSQKMLNLAEELEINNHFVYDVIIKNCFLEFKFLKRKFDIVTACMSLCYDSDLRFNLSKIDNISSKDALLGFVFLKSEIDDIIFDYSNAHFGFSLEFLLKLFEEFKWKIINQEEIEVFISGTKALLFVLQK